MSGEPSGRARAAVVAVLAGETLLLLALGAAQRSVAAHRAAALGPIRGVTRALRLSSLALWPEVSYARSPGQAEPLAPFAAHPGAFEAFPAGSVLPPRWSLSAAEELP